MMDLTRYGSQECSQYDGDGEGDGESDSEDDSRGGCGDHAQILLYLLPACQVLRGLLCLPLCLLSRLLLLLLLRLVLAEREARR